MSRTEEELLTLEQKALVLSGPLVPLLSPIKPSQPIPTLPSRADCNAPFGTKCKEWTCDTFIIPAAFPRSVRGSSRRPGSGRGVAVPVPSKDSKTKIDLLSAQYNVYEPQVEASLKEVDVSKAEQYVDQEQLHLAVNRYSRSTSRNSVPTHENGLTLIFAHANGFHKEIWEPTISDLLGNLEDTKRPKVLPIDEIWALDSVCQGDSAILNDASLGNTFSWADNGRDILNFIISYLDAPSASSPGNSKSASTSLLQPSQASQDLLKLDGSPKKQPLSTSSYGTLPSSRKYRNRTIVGIGHSLGGGGMVFASSACPELFSSLVLLDPVVSALDLGKSQRGKAAGAIIRRDTWESRDGAMEALLKKPFFAAWDERVLQRYVDFGCRKADGGRVVLKTKPQYESLVFADPMGVFIRRAGNRLTSIPPTLPIHFVFADVNRSVLEENQIWAILSRVPHATATRIKDAGHLIPQEQPGKTAEAIANFLRRTYPASKGVAKEAKL